MKTRIFVLALCATVFAGCDSGAQAEEGQTLSTGTAASTAHKPDFAGVSFKMKRSDFEREGYVCKDNTTDGKTTTDCKNFDVRTSVFGIDVKGVSVAFREGEDTPFRIGTELPKAYVNPGKRKVLISQISEYYTSLPKNDFNAQGIELRRWKRNDGAFIQLIAIESDPDAPESSIEIIMFSVKESLSSEE